MADRKCTDLTALAAGSQATGDLLMIVDVSEAAATDKNKKITVESLFKGIPSNVGIGTSSPGEKLELRASSGSVWNKITNGTVTGFFGVSGSGASVDIYGSTNHPMRFFTNAAERMRIDSSGRLLVGLTGNVDGSSTQINFSATLNRGSNATAANANIGVLKFADLRSNSAYGEIRCQSDGTPGTDDYPGRLTFSTTTVGASSPSERMRIDSLGRVLIGTTTAGSGDSDDLTIANSGNTGITIRSGSSNAAAIYFADGTSGSQNYQGIVQYVHSTDELQFYTNYAGDSNARMRIDSSGNVGIGISSPDGKLTLPATASNTPALRLQSASSSTDGALSSYADASGTYIALGANYYLNSSGNGAVFDTNDKSAAILFDGRGSGSLQFLTGSTGVASEGMRIDSSGRLLLGTTSAPTGGDWAQYSKAIFTGSTGSTADAGTISLKRGGTAANGNPLGVLSFSDSNGGEFAYIKCEADGTTGSSDYPGRLVFSTTADGASSSTERMRIRSNGIIRHFLYDEWMRSDGTTNCGFVGRADQTISGGDTANFGISTGGGDLLFGSGGTTERMRLNSSGAFMVGQTNGSAGTPGIVCNANGTLTVCTSNASTSVFNHNDASGTRNLILFRTDGTNRGSITSNGSSTAYNTTSDYRLKENVVDLADGITRVKQLQPRRFNFIADAGTTVDGFLAHEAQTVVPEAVTGTHNEVDDDGNAVMQGIDQSKLVPLLTAALQEAIAEIETLKTKVAALEAG